MAISPSHSAESSSEVEPGTELNDIESSAHEQVSSSVERQVRANEPVLCPPACYGLVVLGSFVAGYGATRAAGNDSRSDPTDTSAANAGGDLGDAPVEDLIEARERLA